VKVLDFGIARMLELSSASASTRSGTTMGTPSYMPPEQARGLWAEVDPRSDLWAVGATMFRLITGRAVHEGRTPNEQLLAAMTARAPAIASLEPATHPAVAGLVDRALAFERDDRWPDARAMRAALREAYLATQGASVTTAPRLDVPAYPAGGSPQRRDVDDPATDAPQVHGATGVALPSSATGRLSLAAAAAGIAVVAAISFLVARPSTPANGAPGGAMSADVGDAPAPALPSSDALPATSAVTAPAGATARTPDPVTPPLAGRDSGADLGSAPIAIDAGAPRAAPASSATPPATRTGVASTPAKRSVGLISPTR
jgi:serine/threonine-protein kinase